MDVKAEPGGYLGCGTVEIWRRKDVCGKLISPLTYTSLFLIRSIQKSISVKHLNAP